MVEAMLSYLRSDMPGPGSGDRIQDVPGDVPDDSEADGDPLLSNP
jgi:hypothetical protein